MREARAAKAAERAAAKEAAEKNGETEEKVKKVTKKGGCQEIHREENPAVDDQDHQ